MQERNDLRNIAIIAHVDHGKTTLVDAMLSQSGTFREGSDVTERVMDSGDIERERGITILAKNAGVHWRTCKTYIDPALDELPPDATTDPHDVKINIIDTPGHADFGGEVERVLKMVGGVLLLVDAAEGCMPQTRFVLQKALAQNLSLVVVVNKVDRPDARPKEVIDEVLELLMDLGATDEQFDAPMVFCSGRLGIAAYSPDELMDLLAQNAEGKAPKDAPGLTPLFETIIEYVKPPVGDAEGPLQMLCSSVDYNEYVGRIGVGRLERGSIRVGDEVALCDWNDDTLSKKGKITALYAFEGVGRAPVEEAKAGDIIAFSGLSDVGIGNTLCAPDSPDPIEFLKINEPTVEMTFLVNDSPYAGKEGSLVTSRQIRDRLHREVLKDVALRVYDGDTTDSFCVMGRGEMHLSILIETMRREGYEFAVGPPRVIYREENGEKQEPMENLVVDVPEEYQGAVMTKMGARKGELLHMAPVGAADMQNASSRMRLEYLIPARGLFGYRSEFLTDTHGEGIMNTIAAGYAPYKGELPGRLGGSLVSYETGEAVGYGLSSAQTRGRMFVGPGEAVYAGMVVGVSPKPGDITVNVCKQKQLTNVRASGSDDALRLTPPSRLSLEESLEFIAADELVEVTPENIRIRKQILNHEQRMKSQKKK